MLEPRSIEEAYESAASTSNLLVKAERRGDADMLIAAGWSKSSIGLALMRLHTKADRNRMNQVHEHVCVYARKVGIDRPEAIASAAISWWISRVCASCKGRKFQLIPNAPSLSIKFCLACRGSGEAALPHGQAGRVLINWMDECKQQATETIKRRLRQS